MYPAFAGVTGLEFDLRLPCPAVSPPHEYPLSPGGAGILSVRAALNRIAPSVRLRPEKPWHPIPANHHTTPPISEIIKIRRITVQTTPC